MVRVAPVTPVIGEMELMNGANRTTKFVELFAVPAEVVTDINPVVAAAGTVAVICVELFTV